MVHSVLKVGGTPRLAPRGEVAAQTFTSTQKPSITGTYQPDHVVTATPGQWDETPTSVTYQWLRQGNPIAGETGPTYTLTTADIGTDSISVRVTPVRSGWVGGMHTSPAITVDDPEPPAPDPDEGLWFAKSQDPATRKVYVHWFRYPLAFSNTAPPNTYESAYLSPSGEGGNHASYGGLLRDRPITRDLLYTDGAGDHAAPFGGSPAWGVQAQRADIEEAIAIGVDGFFHDILGGSGQNWNIALNNFNATAYYPGFELIPMLDCNGGIGQTSSAASIAERMRILLAYDCVPTIGGKKVFASYRSENIGGSSVTNKTAFWNQIRTELINNWGIDVTFWHCFGAPPSQSGMSAYQNCTAVGRWGWGGADPAIIAAAAPTWATAGKALGRKIFPPIFNQWARPKHGEFDESLNTRSLQAAWDKANALCGPDDFVQVCTWNDYSEGHQIAPSQARGYVNWALTAWNIQKFKYGEAPRIVRDAVIVTHRNQTTSSTITGGQTKMMVQRGNANRSAFRQHVEVVTFLTDADTVTLHVGSATYNYTAPAGEYVYSAPAQFGTVRVVTGRGVDVTSPVQIRSSVVNQDRNYMGTYSLRTSQMQGDPTP